MSALNVLHNEFFTVKGFQSSPGVEALLIATTGQRGAAVLLFNGVVMVKIILIAPDVTTGVPIANVIGVITMLLFVPPYSGGTCPYA